jgi:hypothetical protein
MARQRTLSEGDGSVRLTSLSYLVAAFDDTNIINFFYKTGCFNEEVICILCFPLS